MKKLLIFLMILIPLVVIFIVNVTVDIVAGVVTISVDNVVLDYDSHIANINDSFKLNAQIEPEGASDKTIIWSSSDENIATVDAEGNVTFLAFGAVDIIATSGDGLKKDSCHINVTDTRVHDIVIHADKTTLTLGESVHILASVIPNTADNQEYVLRSSNEDVVSINASGMATGKSVGNAIITATSLDGNYEASLSLEVIIPVLSIDIIPQEEQITIGSSSILLSYNITPVNATNKKVIFSSSDPSTATVDATGRVNFAKTGEVVITATTENGNFSDNIKIKYTGGYPLSIDLEQKEANVDISDGALDMKINYTITPADTNILNVYFSSNNTNVATVNQNGLVQMIGGGSATISIKVQTGENTFIYDSVLVNVKQVIKNVVFPNKNIITAVQNIILNPNLIPSDATNIDNIAYEIVSGDSAVLSENGKLDFNNAGSVTVKSYLKDNPAIFDEVVVTYTGGYPYSVEKVEGRIEIDAGQNGSLNFILSPTGVTIREYVFKIVENNPIEAGKNVISIDETSGRFTALSGGTAVVRLYVKSGENAEITTDYEIMVNKVAEDIEFSINEEIYNSAYVTGKNVVIFTANTLPTDSTEDEIIYSISDEKIAKIIGNKIHFNQAGKIVLTASLKSNEKITESVEIWYTGGYAISANVVGLPEKFVANSSSFDISLTDIIPSNATNKSFSVVLSNEQSIGDALLSVLYNSNSTIATINQLNSGTLTLSVVLAGSSSAIYSKNVEVLQKVEKIEFITHAGETPNTQIDLLCNVLPINASIKEVVFELDEKYSEIAKIENNKLIFNDSINEKETVVVLAKLTDIDGSIVESSIEITTTFGKIAAPEGNEITLSPSNTVEYDYSSEILSGYKLTYKILSGNDLTTVMLKDNKIHITALQVGKANIEVQLIDEKTNALFKILANLQITIAEKITNINIESSDLNFVNNKYYTGINEFQVNIVLEPENANLENISAVISDENVATYDKTTGTFKFLKAGIVELTISSNDGSISKKFILQNTNGSSISSEISLNSSNNNLAISGQFEVKLLSFIPTNINLTISSISEITQSGNQKILEIINDNGKYIVKGKEAGRTNIQVTLSDGTIKTFQITVISSITNINFINSEIITANKSYTLNPILTPSNPSNKNLIFESSNQEVATVNNFGIVNFIKKGSVIITVKSEENPEISASINITSTFGEIADFTLNFSALQLMTDEVRLLSVSSVYPLDAARPTFKFEILYMNSNNNSNLDVISLNNGSITALNGGIAVVKVYTTLENGEEVAKTCEITVERTLTMVDIELLTKLDTYQNYYVTSLEEVEFKLITSPIDATISNSKITIDDESIAEIQGNKIVFKNEGLVKLTVQVNNSTKSLTIRHTKTPISFEIDGVSGTVSNNVRTVELNAGEKLTLNAKNVIPSDIFDKSIRLQLVVSSPNNLGDIVCQVNENVITATHGGIAKYKVIVAGKESNEILQVVVIKKATQIEVQREITTSKQIYSLNAKLLPADSTSPLLTYSIISGSEFATIDGLGIITFKQEGEITVKIRNEFSNIETTSKITYSLGARTIEFDAAPDFVFIGKTLQFSIIISPSTIVNEPVVWSILKADGTASGATISQSGLLTPSKFEETVVVTVSLVNFPDVKTSITLDIVAIITDINMDDDPSNDKVGIAEEKVFGTHNMSFTTVDEKETPVFTNTFQLGFNLIHNCATMPKLTYTSSNEQVASIDASGLVTVHAPGKVTISIYPQRQVNSDATKYIYDAYTYNFVSGINLYSYKDFTSWAGLTNDNVAENSFKLGGVLQDTIDFPSMSPSLHLCENKTLLGNGNLINLHNLGKAVAEDNRTIHIKSNTTFRNVQIRAYAFKKDETIFKLDGAYSCLMTEPNSKNVNLEYCLFENAQVNVRIHNSEVNLKGCIIVNSCNGGLLCDSESKNRTPNLVNIENCVFENNVLGCITNMTLEADKAETVSIINLNGFVDFYNWQPLSILNEIDFDSLGNAFYKVIELLIQEKLSTILANHGYIFKTYNNDKYVHLGLVFMECDVQFEGLGIVLKNNGKVNFNTQNNPYALQTIKEPIAVGTITFHAYGLSGSSNHSIQPGVSYKDNIKAVYDKIRRYTQA